MKQKSLFDTVPDKIIRSKTLSNPTKPMFSDREFFEPAKKTIIYPEFNGALGLEKQDPRTDEQKAQALRQEAQQRTTSMLLQEVTTAITNLQLFRDPETNKARRSEYVKVKDTPQNSKMVISRLAPDSYYVRIVSEGEITTHIYNLAQIKQILSHWQIELC